MKIPPIQSKLLAKVICTLSKFIVLCLPILGSTEKPEDIRYFKDFSNPTGALSSYSEYTFDKMAFADIDGDGNEEFLGIERPTRGRFASISRWVNDIRVREWESDDTISIHKFLVGNLDADPLPELLLLDEWGIYGGRDSLYAIDWDGSSYQVISNRENRLGEYGEMTGGLVALIDINQDGTNEILLATSANFIDNDMPESHLLDELKIVRLADNRFEEAFSYVMPNSVLALTTGDLDGDGALEIVTVERPLKPGVLGQIAIHSIDPDKGIQRRAAFNKFTWPEGSGFSSRVRFMSIFHCGQINYLFVHMLRGNRQSIFSLTETTDGKWLLAPVRKNEHHVFTAAKLTTMAYSSEERAYARFVEHDYFEMIPEEHLRTPQHMKMCGSGDD